MSCCQIEILPNESEIDQLRKDLFQARYDANFYKSHYQNGIVIRKRMQYEHDVEILKLKKRQKEEFEHPEVPMDNNAAERELIGGAVGRKNYYGSGSIEIAEFTAIMFTIIQTLQIWKMNPKAWFSAFFDFIGNDWKKPFEHWLPWNMSAEQRAGFAFVKHHDPPK